MTNEVNNNEDLFKDENVPESNWYKFEKVGDRVAGELIETFEKSGDEQFPDQRVYVLKQADGTMVNVGLNKNKEYVHSRMSQVKMGDLVGFEFKKEIPPQKKGFNPAKSIEVYVKHQEKTSDDDDF